MKKNEFIHVKRIGVGRDSSEVYLTLRQEEDEFVKYAIRVFLKQDFYENVYVSVEKPNPFVTSISDKFVSCSST